MVVVEPALRVHSVMLPLKELGRVGQHLAAVPETVGNVAAVLPVHSQDDVPRVEDRAVGHHVRNTAGVALHVHVPDFGVQSEQTQGPFPGHILELVDDPSPPVEPASGKAFRVLVLGGRGQAVVDRLRAVIFGGDQVEVGPLTPDFLFDQVEQLGVLPHEGFLGSPVGVW